MKFNLLFVFLSLTATAAQPFVNDECIGAQAIPTISLPYTAIVNITDYTNNVADPSPTCIDNERVNKTEGRTIWYSFTPTEDGVLSFVTNDLRLRFGPGLDMILGVYTGSCNGLTQVACIDQGFGAKEILYPIVRQGETYYIKVGEVGVTTIGNGVFNLTVLFDPRDLTVVGDECTDAKVISHSSLPFNEIVDTRVYSNNPTDVNNTCSFGNDGNTLWYKYTPPSDGLMIASTVGSVDYLLGNPLDHVLGAYTGSCVALTLVRCVEQYDQETMFYPVKSGVTYTIKVGESFNGGSGLGSLNFSLSFQKDYFNVINEDARPSANVIGTLNDLFNGTYASLVPPNTIDYSQITASSLAIEAKFAQPNLIRSALLKLNDGPAVCESNKPYTISGPFAIGNRLITATGYSRSNCRGTVLATVAQAFSVKACKYIQYGLYDSDRNTYVSNLYNASTISRPPCNMNIGVTFQCGFAPEEVRLELRRASTNFIVARREEEEAPYFLFGDFRSNIFSGSVPAGEYIISARIDGVLHPSVRFTLGTCQRNDLIVDNSFDIDLRFGDGLSSTYEITKLFPPIIKRISSLVIGDRPDVVTTTALAGETDFFCGDFPTRIDDLHICAQIFDNNDGEGGILGFLLNTLARPSDNLPVTGTIILDKPDFDILLANGKVENFILQQLIRTLGLGEYWDAFGLAPREAPCSYNGTKAVAEFNAVTGCSSTSIPLEQNSVPEIDGYDSFDCLFWDPNCLRNEVLTFTIGEKKVSRITLGSLEDLGYVVNYTAADPYNIDDIGTCGCNTGTRALRSSKDNKDEQPTASSCHQGSVYNNAIIGGQNMLRKMHEHPLNQVDRTLLPDDIEFVGHKSVTVAYMHEDGTLCSVIVRSPNDSA